MFCGKCGAQVEDGVRFCPKCGNAMGAAKAESPRRQAGPRPEGKKPERKKPAAGQTGGNQPGKPPKSSPLASARDGVCPVCGSHNCEIQVQQNISGSGSNYNCCYGFCGKMVLGPFGLLCGLSGTGSKTTTTQRSMWVCKDCGNQFPTRQEMVSQWIGSNVSITLLTAFLSGIGILLTTLGFFWGLAIVALAFLADLYSYKRAKNFLGCDENTAVADGLLTEQERKAWLVSTIISCLAGLAFVLFCIFVI